MDSADSVYGLDKRIFESDPTYIEPLKKFMSHSNSSVKLTALETNFES